MSIESQPWSWHSGQTARNLEEWESQATDPRHTSQAADARAKGHLKQWLDHLGVQRDPPSGWWARFFAFFESSTFKTLFIYLLVFVLMILVLIFIGRVVVGGVKGFDISQDNFTRGLVTVLLLAGTLAMVLIVLLTLLFADNAEDIIKRVSIGREVLTPLIGILGTIVGFYFASTTQTGPGLPTAASAKVNSLGGFLANNVLLLDGTAVGDADLPQIIEQHSGLEGIFLDNTSITSAGIEKLHALKQLRWISLKGTTAVTDKGINALKKALPKVAVRR